MSINDTDRGLQARGIEKLSNNYIGNTLESYWAYADII